jgi:uncharacterized protein YdaU (DUF1376 family)
MNYYERHLGDYAKDTAHLSMLEHGAYNLLLDRYYGTEAGIPSGDVYRVARAKTKPEKHAVDSVLKEFFTVVDGAWVKNRVEEEIQRYRDSIPAAEEKKLNDKERQRRARERRKALFTELRELGVVMPWDASTSELQTELSRVTSQTGHGAVTPPVTRDNTASQSPVPSPQSPVEDSHRGEDATSVDKALYADARKIFGKSIGGQVSKAIGLRGKPWVLGVIEACRSKDPEGARAYFAAALNGAHKPDQAEQRKAIP